MRGQLWEPCPKCDTEPVCVDCGYCQRHCRCAADRRTRQMANEINRREPGLLASTQSHNEDGARGY